MDQKVDYIFKLSGNRHLYQYRLLLLSFFIYMNVNILSQSIFLLEKAPDVTYLDEGLGRNITKSINSTICNWKNNYTITKIYKHSIVSYYNAQCDTFLIGLFGSALFLGNLLGTFSFSLLVDRIGRKKLIKVCFIPYLISLILIIFSPNFISMIVFFFLSEFIALNIGLSIVLINTENCHSFVRPFFNCFIGCGFALCGITSSIYSKYFEDWRYFISISFCFSITFITLFLLLVKESPTFFLNKKDLKNFLKSLTKIAKVNKRYKEFEENVIQVKDKEKNDNKNISLFNFFNIYFSAFKENEISINRKKSSIDDSKASSTSLLDNEVSEEYHKKEQRKNFTFFDFFKYKSIRSKFLTFCLILSTISGCYYGLSINIKNLSGDIYTNAIINYSLDIFVYIFAAPLTNVKFLGRKKTTGIFLMLSTIGFLMYLILDISDNYRNVILFGTRFAVSALYSTIGIFILETYPTPARALGYGINQTTSKIIPVITPVFIELFPKGIFLGYLIANFSSLILLIFVLDETIGKPLKEVIEEEEIQLNESIIEGVEKSFEN